MEQEAELSGMRILVVEDEFLVAMASADLLADSGYTVAGPVSSVKQGMRIIEQEAIDGAILDMPRLRPPPDRIRSDSARSDAVREADFKRQKGEAADAEAISDTASGPPRSPDVCCLQWVIRVVFFGAPATSGCAPIAAGADEAIRAAAVQFRTDSWKLIAVRRWEVA
jgi:hypothetical protein